MKDSLLCNSKLTTWACHGNDQFSLGNLLHKMRFSSIINAFVLLSECHEWSTVPIFASLRHGPRVCFRNGCCTSGGSMAAPRVKPFPCTHPLALTVAPEWTSSKLDCQVFGVTRLGIEPSLPALVARVEKRCDSACFLVYVGGGFFTRLYCDQYCDTWSHHNSCILHIIRASQ